MELTFKSSVSSAVWVRWTLNFLACVCTSLKCNTNSIFVKCVVEYKLLMYEIVSTNWRGTKF
jgi:hypothetical protein